MAVHSQCTVNTRFVAIWSLFRRRVIFPYFTLYWSVKVRHPSHLHNSVGRSCHLRIFSKGNKFNSLTINLPNFLLPIPQPFVWGWEESSFLNLMPLPINLLFMLFYISCLWIGKDPDAGKEWRQEEKGVTENEMLGWCHWFNGHEFEQTPGDSEGQGSLECCSHGVAKNRTWLSNWATEQYFLPSGNCSLFVCLNEITSWFLYQAPS